MITRPSGAQTRTLPTWTSRNCGVLPPRRRTARARAAHKRCVDPSSREGAEDRAWHEAVSRIDHLRLQALVPGASRNARAVSRLRRKLLRQDPVFGR
jgi:hypothetical protein